MTDNEIINIAENCIRENPSCISCPFDEDTYTADECMGKLIAKLVDINNRQKAEIERLQKAGEESVSCFTRMESLYKIKCKELDVAKTEAIKEFVGRLKKTMDITYETVDGNRGYQTEDYFIDNLLKEMTEGGA